MTYFSDLVDGYGRFRTTGYEAERQRWEQLNRGQSPKVMVIACSDSRVEPAEIFDTSPGDIFVLRNVANLVPPLELDGGRHGVSAALEFAVTQLEVEEILVLGHGACGGVHAAMTQRFKGTEPGRGGFIAHWVDLLDEARDRVFAEQGDGPDAIHALELETVRVSIANLRTFPCVQIREARGSLTIHGAWFAIASGELHVLGDDGEFHVA